MHEGHGRLLSCGYNQAMRWSLLFLVACGGGSAMPDAPFGDAFLGPGPDTQLCATICAGQCVDLDTDPMHCGICTRQCTSDLPACVGGTCALSNETTVALHFGGAAVTSVASDASGNLYMTGSFTGTVDFGGGPLASAGATDIFLASYTSAGAYRWAKAFGGTGGDVGAGIAVSDQLYAVASFAGAVSFAGTMLTSAGGTDIVVLEMDSTTGDLFAAHSWGTATDDTAYAIAWTPANQLVIGGAFGMGTFDLDGQVLTGLSTATGFVAQIAVDGSAQWARQLGESSGSTSACRAIAIDSTGNAVIAGGFTGTADFGFGEVPASGSDAFVASFTSSGAPNWVHTFGAADDDTATAVAVDMAGDVAVGGNYHGAVDFGAGAIPSIGTLDGFLVGYSALGAFQFARHLGAATSSSVSGVAMTATGTILATGTLAGAADFGTGALAPLGQTDIFIAGFGGVAPTFAKRYGGADVDAGAAIAPGPGVYVTAGGTFRGTVDLGTGSIAGGAGDNGYLVVIAP